MQATNIAELRALLEGSKPGDLVVIEGYKSSSGAVSDLVVVKMEHDDYRRMQTTSLARLKEFSEKNTDADKATVARAMIQSLEKNLFGEKTTAFRDIYRDAGGFHVHRDSGTMDEIYLLRAAVISDSIESSDPKSDDAKMKRAISIKCSLPTNRYRHSLKFSEGSFKSVNLFKLKELTEARMAEAAEATGKNETLETNELVP